MKKLKDLSISKKLLTNFLCLLTIILIVGIVGIVGMARIDQMDTYLYTNQTEPIAHLMNATKSLYQIRVDARSATINAGKADKIQQYENDYLNQKKTFLAESAAYTASITSADSLAAAKEASNIFSNTFDPVIQKTFDLAKAGDQAASDAAGSAVTDKVQTLFNDYDKLSGNRMASAKSTSDSNDATAMVLTIVLGVIIVLGACAALALSRKISRSISLPIADVVSGAKKIALGRVDVDLSHIGAKTAKPESVVVNAAGDGSFRMNCAELATLSHYKIPVVELIFDNRTLGMVRQWQKLFYDNRFSQTDVDNDIDYGKLAEAFGVKSFCIRKKSDIEPVLREALACGSPVLVDCIINKDENVLPMVPAGKSVEDPILTM